ncbi:MAG: polyprenyl synthetase family protein, partial [Microcella sp.]
DLREGKRTVMVAFACSTPAWARLGELIGKHDLTEEEAEEARDLLAVCGARAFAENLARDFAQRALARLAEPHIPAALRDELHPVAAEVLDRVK